MRVKLAAQMLVCAGMGTAAGIFLVWAGGSDDWRIGAGGLLGAAAGAWCPWAMDADQQAVAEECERDDARRRREQRHVAPGEQLLLFPPAPLFDDAAFDAARELVEDLGGDAVAEAVHRERAETSPLFRDYRVSVRRAVKFILRGGTAPMT
jgi:hypothetical protein